MKAKVTLPNGLVRNLSLIEKEVMDVFYTNPLSKDTIGFPSYFDESKRVWPKEDDTGSKFTLGDVPNWWD